MPRGTDGNTASSITKSTAGAVGPTMKAIASGPATTATGPAIPAHSSPLSEEDLWEVARLRQIRKRGQMLTMGECDWLLEICERWKP